MARARAKDYEALGRKNITKPSKAPARTRIAIYSRNKRGKTRFCLTANELKGQRILIIDPEHGTDKFKKQDPDVWHVSKWEHMDDVLGYLRLGKHPYTWVAVDGMTKINNMALKFIMRLGEEANLERRPGIVDRRDYGKSGELIKTMALSFDALPLGVIYTMQEKTRTVEDEEDETSEASTFFIPDLPDSPRGTINSIVDVIGRLYVAKAQFKNPDGGAPIEKNQRRLYLDNHPQYDTGYRSEYELPPILKNPTVPALLDLLDKGK